jgi:hypothetical protein
MQDWTTPADLADQVLRVWIKGRILAARMTGEPLFPLALRLRRPDTRAYGAHFEKVRNWIRVLEEGARTRRGFGYDIEWTEINHRQLGRNKIPDRVAVPTETDALKLIGTEKEAVRFDHLRQSTELSFPMLTEWLARKPFVALDHARDWSRILAVLAWFRDHPNSDLYLRQLDIESVDTKFIENRKPLLGELLALVAPRAAKPQSDAPAETFEQRYGLKSKSPIIRFRVLDRSLAVGGLLDLATPIAQFASLAMPARRIFITENEVNGLAFPDVADGMVVFGLGYGLELLSSAVWMQDREIYYWGDIDTHGFAMLDRLRTIFPAARSLLMDRETLLAHRALWVRENTPFRGPLIRLEPEERELFEALVQNRLGDGIRLEQERVSFRRVRLAIQDIAIATSHERSSLDIPIPSHKKATRNPL